MAPEERPYRNAATLLRVILLEQARWSKGQEGLLRTLGVAKAAEISDESVIPIPPRTPTLARRGFAELTALDGLCGQVWGQQQTTSGKQSPTARRANALSIR